MDGEKARIALRNKHFISRRWKQYQILENLAVWLTEKKTINRSKAMSRRMIEIITGQSANTK